MSVQNTPSSLLWTITAGGAAGILRSCIATPLERLAFEAQIHDLTTRESARRVTNIYSGVSAGAVKNMTKTPANFVFTGIVSHLTPTSLSPSLRGSCIGLGVAGLESVAVIAPLNLIKVRLMQGEKLLTILRTERASIFIKGQSAVLAHRTSSWLIFYGVYEGLKARYPDSHFAVSTAAGAAQVVLTSPFSAAISHKQKAKAIQTSLVKTITGIYAQQGWKGVSIRGLPFRLMHSMLTSGPLMWLIDKQLGLIQR